MGLYQRRRPSPIKIFPNPARRQDVKETGSPDSPDSPDSPGTAAGPDSPDSPDTTAPAATATTLPGLSSTAPAQVISTSAASSSVNQAGSASAARPPAAAPSTTTNIPPQRVSTSATTMAQAVPAFTSASSSMAPSAMPPSNAPSITARPPPGAAADVGDDPNEPESPKSPKSPASPTSSGSGGLSSSAASTSSANPVPTSTGPPARLAGESAGIDKDPPRSPGHKVIGVGAEAALITSAVLGFVALLVGAYFLYKRRKRRNTNSLRQSENGFAPSTNHGSLAEPETVHIGFDPSGGGGGHITRSTNNSDSLFGGSHYQRPETVSTDPSASRIQANGLPTPNPFADDPSRNKAFDQLRGRPRSTTLTDRGSWVKNPFRDPQSDRFDPFGELQEKARAERVRYVNEVRAEEEDRKRRELEQQFLEKERMGLGVPDVQGRKGSGVTLEGVGVLDRSGGGGYR